MARRLPLETFQLYRDIVLWAIDSKVADGNPWICQLAAQCGEDHGWRLRVWRRVDSSAFAEAFVYIDRIADSEYILYHLLTMHTKYVSLKAEQKLTSRLRNQS